MARTWPLPLLISTFAILLNLFIFLLSKYIILILLLFNQTFPITNLDFPKIPILIVLAVLAGIRRIAKSLKELAGLSFLQFISSTRPIAKLFDLQIILQGVRLVVPTLKHDNNVQIIIRRDLGPV